MRDGWFWLKFPPLPAAEFPILRNRQGSRDGNGAPDGGVYARRLSGDAGTLPLHPRSGRCPENPQGGSSPLTPYGCRTFG